MNPRRSRPGASIHDFLRFHGLVLHVYLHLSQFVLGSLLALLQGFHIGVVCSFVHIAVVLHFLLVLSGQTFDGRLALACRIFIRVLQTQHFFVVIFGQIIFL